MPLDDDILEGYYDDEDCDEDLWHIGKYDSDYASDSLYYDPDYDSDYRLVGRQWLLVN